MTSTSSPRMPSDICIVVAEDDATILDLLRLILEGEGYQVVTATNGREALELIEREPPAVLLLDIHMPVLDGPAVLRALKSQGREIPVVLLSAERDGVGRELVAELGAVAFVEKPFEIDDVIATVHKYCP